MGIEIVELGRATSLDGNGEDENSRDEIGLRKSEVSGLKGGGVGEGGGVVAFVERVG